jgi:hypothetical protein
VNVSSRKLPILLRLFQTRQKSLLLFFFGKIQEEFANHYAIAAEITLIAANILKALLPDILRNERTWDLLISEQLLVDANHQHFLVIGTVEDSDPAAAGSALHSAPQIIVV